MASIHPFRALRPAPDRAAAVSSVPYDVVSTEEARQLADDAYRLASSDFERTEGAGYGGTVVINGETVVNGSTRTVRSSIRSTSTSTPMPGAAGTLIVPSVIVHSGMTMSRSQ